MATTPTSPTELPPALAYELPPEVSYNGIFPTPANEPFLVRSGGAEIEIVVHGYTQSEPVGSAEGICITVFYTATTLTPDTFQQGLFARPNLNFALRIDDVDFDEFALCEDQTNARDEGFGVFESAVTGASVSRSSSVLLPSGTAVEIDSIVVEQPFNTALGFVEVGRLDERPPAAQTTRPLSLPSGPGLAGAVSSGVEVGDDTWDISFQGIVLSAIEDEDAPDFELVCASVIGTIQLTDTPSPTTAFRTPRIELVAGGLEALDDSLQCDIRPFFDSGYQSYGSAVLTLGGQMHFARHLVIPADRVDQLTTVIVDGGIGSTSQQFFEAEVIGFAQIEPAVLDPGEPLKAAAGSITAAEFQWTDERAGTTFDVFVAGLVQYPSSIPELFECYAVVGEMTPDQDIEAFSPKPSIAVIATGQEFTRAALGPCSLQPFISQGYESISGESGANVVLPFYEPIAVVIQPDRELEAVVIGERDSERLVFQPDLIDEIPATGG